MFAIASLTNSDVGDNNTLMTDHKKFLEEEHILDTLANDGDNYSNSVSKDIFTYVNVKTASQNERSTGNVTGDIELKTKNGKGIKRIILYHIYHTGLKWAAKLVDMQKCYHHQNCEIIHHGDLTRDPIDADAVVFQGNNIPLNYPARLNSNQAFVYLNIESPQYLHHVKTENPFYREFFNWTMTYRRDSDIPYLYGSVIPRMYNKTYYLANAEKTVNFREKVLNADLRSDIDKKNYSSIFRNKKKSCVWFASHCRTSSKRELYVSRLKTYIDIDIFGACGNTKHDCQKGDQGCKDNAVKSYKFFLAFENSICEDYITEKVFSWITEDIILVVRGARFYKRYLPDDTYIDADDFKTKEDLANFLIQLGANEKKYIKYLKTKDKYIVIQEQEHIQLAYCNLCYKLNNLDMFRKSATPLDKWWITDRCVKPTDYIF
jgi:alpha-1,3-fucosyltransferase